MKLLCAVAACVAIPCLSFAQQTFANTAKDAFVLTRMVHKFHVQPKPIDDNFSRHVFKQVLHRLDRQKAYFTAEDVQSLSAFKEKLDEEITGKQTTFVQQLHQVYQRRVSQADTMIDAICRQPFNFTIAETFTVAEDTSYPANDAALRKKVYKMVKRMVLNSMLEDNEELAILAPAQQKKYVDSAEAVFRKKINRAIKRSIQRRLQSPGGLQQLVGNEYCKAIAVCFDPHTAYMAVSEKENFEAELGNKEMSFGFKLDEDEGGNITIDKLKAGSPAFKSGQLNEGDKIESVQWEGQQPIDVATSGIEEVTRILSASNHDKAILKVKKADGSSRQVTLWKEKLETDEEDDERVKSYILKGAKTVGYISLPAFYTDWENEEVNVNGCANDVAKEIVKLKKENIEGLVIDLRYNGGGSMVEAVELAGIFIDAGPVAAIKRREEKVITLKDVNRGTIYDGPLVIMVNGHSASASEMLAGTLQDYNRAVIVGTPTYGKATAQVILPMDTTITPTTDPSKVKTDSYLKTTVSQLYRVNGTTAQAHGVVPDVVLPDLLDAFPEREADALFAIRSANIEANKYYKPNAALPIASLQAGAKTKLQSVDYFKQLEKFVQLIKEEKKQKDVSLKLADALKLQKHTADDAPSYEDEKAPVDFKVMNNSFELQRMQANKDLSAVNEEWKDALLKDPYVQVVYHLVQQLIK